MKRIETQLRQFKRKYWLAKWLQGVLVFCGTGVVFFALAALFEYFSWLSTQQRFWLFSTLILVEVGLLAYYIGWPLIQLALSGRALPDKKAAEIIGENLSGVDDRLINYLQMKSYAEQSDLIDAGLEQKQAALSNFRFVNAIKLSSLKPFLLFLIPLVLLASFLAVGDKWFMLEEGTKRLVNYDIEFERALPFSIQLDLDQLTVEEGQDFVLDFAVVGDVLPDEIVLETSKGSVNLSRKTGNSFSHTFTNCFTDVDFRFVYDDISSSEYKLEVLRKAKIGRVTIQVTPPTYTGIEPFEINNSSKIEVPQYSEIKLNYVFSNTAFLTVLSSFNDTVLLQPNEELVHKAATDISFTAYASGEELNTSAVDVLRDKRPIISVNTDSLEEGLGIKINMFDEYKLVSSNLRLVDNEDETEVIDIPNNGLSAKSAFLINWEDVARLKEVEIRAQDNIGLSVKKINLVDFREKEETKNDLMNDAGKGIEDVKELLKDEEDNANPGSKKEDLKKKSSEINKKAKALSKKDSVQYQRFEQLSEEIQKLAEDLNKDIPESRKKMKEMQLEEKIKQLEKEWMVLKNIENLKQLEDSLKMKPGAVDEEQMKKLEEEANQLEEMLKKEQEQDKVDWEKFDELKKKNKELKKENGSENDKESADKKEEKQEGNQEKEGEKKSEESQQDENSEQQDNKKGDQKDLKQEMQNNSEQLREQLGKMSDLMMMEATQKNIELLRRLELRSLKTSKGQEEVFVASSNQTEIDRQVMVSQKEVINSSKQILDSLSALNVSNAELGAVLTEYQVKLDEHLSVMSKEDPANYRSFVSSQRYLQFGLNELAAVLYDILKSEQQNMMDMKSGNKQCNNPKPGKGKKPSMGKKQSELGGKMKEMQKKGKGKSKGKQSYSQSELLELIKGQEAIIEQYEQENKGKKAGGDAKLAEDLNKQLDDLIRGDINKALERNKDIEDKLITLEESENKKKEQEEKRQSKENALNYDAIKQEIVSDYLKENQRGSRIVNLPALKNYYTGKWITINQE